MKPFATLRRHKQGGNLKRESFLLDPGGRLSYLFVLTVIVDTC